MNIKINYERDKQLADYSRDMLMDFYAKGGEESPQDIFARASWAWSNFKGIRDEALAQRLYDYVSKGWFMFASPVLSNAPDSSNKAKGLPISCFLTYVPDTIEGLIDHSSELRLLSVMGGGVGGHWSDVRGVSDIAPGPIPFLHTVDADMTAYRQGKTRKGSYAAYINVDHPDVMEFIGLRIPTGDVNRKCFNLHNAVNITDGFMSAVKAGTKYELIDPKKGNTGEWLDARVVWQKLLETRFRTGEPYLNFIDTANEALPQAQKDLGLSINGSNLCNEIHLVTNEDRTAVCCLSSVNLEHYSDWVGSTMIADLITMLDNVLEYFIENCPTALYRAKYSASRERSLGLGAMGFHNALQRNNVAFGSEDSVAMNEEMFSYIKKAAVQASRLLAGERGEAPDMVGTGMRNAHLLAIAPNASSSIIISSSPCIEPNKANAYTHRTRAGSFLVQNRYLKDVLEALGKNTQEVWSNIITNSGSVQHLDFLDDQTKKVFATSFEIDQMDIVKLAGQRQRYICQGQSVNLFFPSGADRAYVNKVHLSAWEQGLKGLYYLRTEATARAENVSKKVESNKLIEEKRTIVYGKDNCPHCANAKGLLAFNNIEYEYIDIEVEGKTAAEITGRPDVRTVPQIYLKGEYIGGFTELSNHLQNQITNTESDECLACEG